MNAPSHDRLASALAAAALELPLFPVNWPVRSSNGVHCSCGLAHCQSPAKHPYFRLAPNGLKNAVRDPDVIRRIWRAVPQANIGVRTGDVSVLDIDPRHGGDETLAGLIKRYGKLPLTWQSLTGGGGEHIYFRAPRGVLVRNSAGAIGPGIDVRGAGGYVLAPGSAHISGRSYEWSVDHHPDDVPLADAPAWLVDLMVSRSRAKSRTAKGWLDLVVGRVPEGQRNHAAASLCGHLLGLDVDAEVALVLLRAWNAAHCQPPLSDSEIVAVARSIARRELSRGKGARDGR